MKKKGIHLDLYNSRKTKGRNLNKALWEKRNSYIKQAIQIFGFHLPFCGIMHYNTCIVSFFCTATALQQVPRFSPVDGAGDGFFSAVNGRIPDVSGHPFIIF